MDLSIFKAYDIRGVYPEQINEENISKISKAIFSFFVKKLRLERSLKLVLSYDGRISTPSLVTEVRNALVDSGADVTDIGLSTTPTFYFALTKYDFNAGLQISASHNPKEYNGIKFAFNTNGKITKIGRDTGMDKVRGILEKEEFVSTGKKGSVVEKKDVLNNQVKNAFDLLGNPKIGKLKIVADAANAVGALYLEKLFENLPCELVKMNFEIDGNFPSHQPDPLKFETLKDLQKQVVKENADLGIAPDGDGDRVFFINEKGGVIPASLITSLVASRILNNNKGENVVVDVRNTLNTKEAIRKAGGKLVMTRVGHALITEKMKETNAVFAGENSGHYFFRDTGFGEDPLPVILTILSEMTKEDKPISEILKTFSVAAESGEINFRTENAQKIRNNLENKYGDGQISVLDGLSVDYPEWRFNLRLSNTEPLLRLNVESLDKKIMEEKKNEIIKIIENNI